ncbi:hypothetical protein E4U12_001608, partial [Claviceps purpurea]
MCAKRQLPRRPPLFLKYRHHRTQIVVGSAIVARTQIRRRRTAVFAESDEIRFNRPSPIFSSKTECYRKLQGSKHMTPVSCKSPEQDELPEGRGRFGLCACRRATDRRRESLLFTTPTGLNDRGIKISLRLSRFEIDRRRFAS